MGPKYFENDEDKITRFLYKLDRIKKENKTDKI